jgi:hypothetical protein
MDEDAFNERLSFLLDCFPDSDWELLTRAVVECASMESAIDYMLAHIYDEEQDCENDESAKGEEEEEEEEEEEVTEKVWELRMMFPKLERSALVAFVAAAGPDATVKTLAKEISQMIERDPMALKGEKWKLPKDILPEEYCAWNLTSRSLSSSSRSPTEQKFKSANIIKDILQMLLAKLDVPLDGRSRLELREEAHRVQEERKTNLQKAAEAYQSGGLTGTSSAQYYSTIAMDKKRIVDSLYRQAAYMTFLEQFSVHK